MKNKIYTKSYFCKKLADAGIMYSKLDINYHIDDRRKWSIIVDPNNRNIMVTCYKTTPENFYFDIISSTKSIRQVTLSSDVVISYINEIAQF